MDKTDYVGEAERQLANQFHYKRLEINRRSIDAGQLSYLKCPEDPAP